MKPALILVAVGLVYSTTLDVPFTFDDDPHLVEGSAGRTARQALATCPGDNRCVGFLTFVANDALGGLEVRGYHAVNLLIHACTSLLVYWLVSLLLRTPRVRDAKLPARASTIALGTALLFAVHPLQTMAVTYVIQRFASLVACFYVLSVATFVAARLEASRRRRRLLFATSLLAAVLAMKTKENAVTLPAALVLVEWVFFEGPLAARLKRLAPWAVTLALPAWATLAHPNGGTVAQALADQGAMPRLAYLATQCTVIPAYLRLLVLPVGQSLDHDPPRFGSLLSPAPLAGAVFLCALLGASLFVAWRPPRGDRRWILAGAGGLWFFLALSVESSVIPIKDVMVEHRLYLPSVGFFLAVTIGWASVVAWGRSAYPSLGRGLGAVGLLAGVALGGAAFARNQLWRDELGLWLSASRLAPDSWRPLGNAGQTLLEGGRCLEAIPLLEAARVKGPRELVPLLDLGLCHEKLGDFVSARREFEEAMVLSPGDPRAVTQLGRIYERAGELDRAREVLERAVSLRPDSSEARAGLGAVYGQLGLLSEAREHLERAVALEPSLAVAWNNLGNVRAMGGDAPGAVEAYRRALSLDPADASSRENLARLLEQRGEVEAARMLRSGH